VRNRKKSVRWQKGLEMDWNVDRGEKASEKDCGKEGVFVEDDSLSDVKYADFLCWSQVLNPVCF
jgi:hypothetical protein